MKKIFTSSWGQLEKGGSNVGDEAIFVSQIRDLSTIDQVQIGVLSAVPVKTEKIYGARGFDVGRGRLRAMVRGVRWSDIVIVGGGELAQDRSSLLYTPFNLHPIRLAKRYRKPAFAWSVGIGQGEELARWTPGQLKKWLGYCSGVTVRDGPSYDTLMGLGLDPSKVKLASDSTFTLAGDFAQLHGSPEVLGVALRNVSNRQGRLLPLELRRKLGLYRKPDRSAQRKVWAGLLDRHIETHGGEIRFFPFHTGSLSNSDDEECIAVMSMMEHSEHASVVMPTDIRSFLNSISECRLLVTVPLHGSILSVVTGTVPIAVPYASKGFRFMDEVGLSDLTVDTGAPDWPDRLWDLLERTWESSRDILQDIAGKRSQLAEKSTVTLDLFRSTCL
ncbi:MAG: polysaccharide pyruvyl transferase family protein [Candidatus Fermentibacteraceae bacterium]|nr:polysaccharide pyruvyl transferase family protein [Candidatus Fermentibacteraceae bacterium]MBN2607508.1 polysaccharide pyruvyl transferase family protein [Candidatus Fermentibacteraceae bacterium]